MSDEEKPHGGRPAWMTRWWVISAVVVLVIVVFGGFLTVTGGPDSTSVQVPGPVSRPSDAAPTPKAAATTSDRCEIAAGPQAFPGMAPQATWELVGAVAAPGSEVFGPARVDERGVRSCFAHSPTGAVFAVANIAVTSADANVQVAAIEQQVVPGRVKDLLLEQIETSGPTMASGAQVAGFKIDDYTDQSAAIDLLLRTRDGDLVAIPTALVWMDGDWKQVLPESGRAGGRSVSNPAGFIVWSGVA